MQRRASCMPAGLRQCWMSYNMKDVGPSRVARFPQAARTAMEVSSRIVTICLSPCHGANTPRPIRTGCLPGKEYCWCATADVQVDGRLPADASMVACPERERMSRLARARPWGPLSDGATHNDEARVRIRCAGDTRWLTPSPLAHGRGPQQRPRPPWFVSDVARRCLPRDPSACERASAGSASPATFFTLPPEEDSE
eukprot:355334-Chlamydomonas_euryale.AAC.4